MEKKNLLSYSKKELISLNVNLKTGSQWIKNIHHLNDKDQYVIHPTGEYTIASGRLYIALPSDKNITIEDKKSITYYSFDFNIVVFLILF